MKGCDSVTIVAGRRLLRHGNLPLDKQQCDAAYSVLRATSPECSSVVAHSRSLTGWPCTGRLCHTVGTTAKLAGCASSSLGATQSAESLTSLGVRALPGAGSASDSENGCLCRIMQMKEQTEQSEHQTL